MAKKETQNTKEQIFWAIFESVIQLEVIKGYGKWKITDLSRISKVSRPLIYYYFGKSKDEIIRTAVDYLGAEYFGLSESRLKMWASGQLTESVLISLHLSQKSPFTHVYYMTRRLQQNEIGKILRDYEKQFRSKIKLYFADLDEAGVDGMAGTLFGLVAYPGLTDDGVRKSIHFICKDLKLRGS